MQKIVPAILTNDLADLRHKLSLLRGIAEFVHVDIMDNTFVPHASVPISALQEFSGQFLFEAHLMVADPLKYLDECRKVGISRVVFHAEAGEDPGMVLDAMEADGFEKGIALNPASSAGALTPYVGKADFVLLLGVEPGAQGNPFVPAVLEKARDLRGKITVGLDGGIRVENLKEVFDAGADYAVIGSAIWQSENPLETFRRMREMVE